MPVASFLPSFLPMAANSGANFAGKKARQEGQDKIGYFTRLFQGKLPFRKAGSSETRNWCVVSRRKRLIRTNHKLIQAGSFGEKAQGLGSMDDRVVGHGMPGSSGRGA